MRRFWGAASVAAAVLCQQLVPAPASAADEGGVLAWGWDGDGQLGDGGFNVDRLSPVATIDLDSGSSVVAATAGGSHSLALRADGSVVAWGDDGAGQLGDVGGPVDRSRPTPVAGLGPGSGVVAVAAGLVHSLALRSDGTVLAWGGDVSGQLGDGGTNADRTRPVVVSGLGPGSGVVAVAAGFQHSLAVRHDGSVLAWGSDAFGQLGNGPGAEASRPVAVSGLGAGSGVVAVAAGEGHSVAVRGDGSVLAWGDDLFGQVGDGGVSSPQPAPVAVSGLGPGSGVVAVAAGGRHNLALRSDGSVVAWGHDSWGQIGDGGANTPRSTPVAVTGLGAGSGVVAVAAGYDHSLAARADGSVVAWGWDAFGQLGGGMLVGGRSTPAAVSGLGPGSGVVAVAGGIGHSLAVKPAEQGYSLVAADGGVFNFGSARFFGSTGGLSLNRRIVGLDHTPTNRGYWLVAADGGIFAYGDAPFLGSTGGLRLNRPVVGLRSTPTGRGYWLVASDGGIFAYGDAAFLGSTGGVPLNQPIVGMEATPTGRGYWLVAADGGIFAFGDAAFRGSTGGVRLNRPVVAMAGSRTGGGYHLVASDGGIFAFGDATFRGSTGGVPLRAPIVGIMPTRTGSGYWLCARDGGIFAFGSAPFKGSMGGAPLNRPIVGCDAT